MRTHDSAGRLVGSRLVLLGTVLYLFEWIAIFATGIEVPFGSDATSRDLATYEGIAGETGWAAGWFSVVLLGRIVFVVGLRSGLVASGHRDPLLDVAVAAMAVGVVAEVLSYALATGAAQVAERGGDVLTLDQAAAATNTMLYGPTGVAVLAAVAALWRSGLVSRVSCVVGGVGGLVLTVAGLALTVPDRADALDAATAAVALVWIWMIWLGVVFWRATPARNAERATPSGNGPL
jgi:hypothetical protein